MMPLDWQTVGHDLHRFIADVYPLCRSITGEGLRETLRCISKHIPLAMHEVPTGTEVFDWTVPREWNIHEAYVKNSQGERIIDFQQSNLHVLGYSVPVHKTVSLQELKAHLFSVPEYPDWVPYRSSFYRESWGFCLSHHQLMALPDDTYEVYIDASLEDGFLTYGECYLEGDSEDEVLISCHTCHPSLCNDNLSGIAVAVFLARYVSSLARKHSYRFLFLPTTIGSITWLALNEAKLSRITHGLVLACLGDAGYSTYKKSRHGAADIDRIVAHVLQHAGQPYDIVDFSPFGYDERQYSSPGLNLPVGCLMRTPNGRFPQYHTSADNIDFVQPGPLADSFAKCVQIVDILEHNTAYLNLKPKGEPQLGKRGLYRPLDAHYQPHPEQLALLWVLNLSDGRHRLLDIAERAGMRFDTIRQAAETLLAHGLLQAAGSH